MSDDWDDQVYLERAAILDNIFNEGQRRLEIARALKQAYLRGCSNAAPERETQPEATI